MNWISVKDFLPSHYKECLVYPRPTPILCTAEFNDKGWFYYTYDRYEGYCENQISDITHWIYLPEDPKGEQK